MPWVIIIIEQDHSFQGCSGLFDSEDSARDAAFGRHSALRTLADTTKQPLIVNGQKLYIAEVEQTSGPSSINLRRRKGDKAPPVGKRLSVVGSDSVRNNSNDSKSDT